MYYAIYSLYINEIVGCTSSIEDVLAEEDIDMTRFIKLSAKEFHNFEQWGGERNNDQRNAISDRPKLKAKIVYKLVEA